MAGELPWKLPEDTLHGIKMNLGSTAKARFPSNSSYPRLHPHDTVTNHRCWQELEHVHRAVRSAQTVRRELDPTYAYSSFDDFDLRHAHTVCVCLAITGRAFMIDVAWSVVCSPIISISTSDEIRHDPATPQVRDVPCKSIMPVGVPC